MTGGIKKHCTADCSTRDVNNKINIVGDYPTMTTSGGPLVAPSATATSPATTSRTDPATMVRPAGRRSEIAERVMTMQERSANIGGEKNGKNFHVAVSSSKLSPRNLNEELFALPTNYEKVALPQNYQISNVFDPKPRHPYASPRAHRVADETGRKIAEAHIFGGIASSSIQ